ncbi:HAD domain-containing protein [Streptomyces sp. NPDC004327]|uniref:HAD domain-containing protein n=1 Tax=Streptomyces sp. NPDC004327 TaxID=3364699 RepID=UPI003685128B
MRPLLFLDVDGPLIPFGAPAPYPSYAPAPPPDARPLLSPLAPAHGPRLAALGCELVWATTWGHDANELLAPRLGLRPLPVVDWPDDDPADAAAGLHWKTRALSVWAGGRPYVWLDDEITGPDRAWTAAHHPAPALLHRVDPRTGLGEGDYAAVAAWVARLAAGPGVPAGPGTAAGPGVAAGAGADLS